MRVGIIDWYHKILKKYLLETMFQPRLILEIDPLFGLSRATIDRYENRPKMRSKWWRETSIDRSQVGGSIYGGRRRDMLVEQQGKCPASRPERIVEKGREIARAGCGNDHGRIP